MNEIGTSVREREIYKVTLVGSLVNILLVVCKFAAGFGGKSAAMIADAVHSLSDLITDLIVIVCLCVFPANRKIRDMITDMESMKHWLRS